MWLLKRILFYLAPAMLVLYGGGKFDGVFFGHPSPAPAYELMSSFAAIIITCVIVPFTIEKSKREFDAQENLIGILLKNLRDNLNVELEHQFGMQHLDLNIRIFVPKKKLHCWARKTFLGERVFFLTSHSKLCKDSIDALPFKVAPYGEGLIGKVYEDKCMYYDNQLTKERSADYYKLNPHQISLLSDTKFVAALPIFKKGSKDKISAIVSFDTKKCVTLPQNSDWEKSVRESVVIISQCIPYICKKN